MLEFNVKNQIITRTDKFDVVADSRNYLTAHFNLSEEWTGDVTAVFGFDGRFYHVVLDENSTCIVPFEVIKTPMFAVSLFCGEESLITANVATVEVERSGMVEGEVPDTPTPIVWQQYMTAMQELIESGLPYIGDNGNWFLYNTEKGDYEDTGITARAVDGYTPQKGVDYWTDADKAEIKSDVATFVVNVTIGEDGTVTADKNGLEIVQAYNEGRNIIAVAGNAVCSLTMIIPASNEVWFTNINREFQMTLWCMGDSWGYSTNSLAYTYQTDALNTQITNNSNRITTLETNVGDVETALDNIIAIQNNLMGVSE